jgi:rubrerythrin
VTSVRITRAGLIAAAAGGGGAAAVLLAPGTSASAAQDVRVLNFALLLEEVEAAFYADALSRGALRGEVATYARTVAAHERQHVAFLRKALGAKARKRPRLDFRTATATQKRFIVAAVALEDNNVAAYNGQAANLSAGALEAAGKIVSVEARHAAWIRDIAGLPPAADATDAPRTEGEALAAVRQLGFLR